MRAVPLALAILVAAAGPALAFCRSHDRMLVELERDYGELPVAIGLSNGGAVLEILASKNGVTFTVIITRPDGMSCTLSVGESFELIAAPAEGDAT